MDKKLKYITGVLAAVMVAVFLGVFVSGLIKTTPDGAKADKQEGTTPDNEVVNTQTDTNSPTQEDAKKDYLTLSFIGDCILGSESGRITEGNFSHTAENNSHDYFFSQVKDELSKDDLTIANMECVLTDRELEKIGKDYEPAYWYKAPTVNADILTLGSVEVASVVNNHVNDYGEEGYKDTVAALEGQGLYVGENLTPLYIEKNGIKIGLLSCNLWSSYNVYYIEEALEEMQDKCEYKIVFFHGGTEGVYEPDNYKIDACRYLAQSGLCDLIVGSHPHRLQPMEVVNGVPILYSLGNFCYSAANYPDNKTVIFRVELKKTDNGIITETELIPCYVYTGWINNFQPALMPEGQDKESVLQLMATPVEHIEETTEEETEAPTEALTEPLTKESFENPVAY